ncbi:ABC transporter [Rhodococcus zopfii]|uniref:ABC transporter n=1 Tax=Rhodococcus zopfii TaxID=43772 RepID=UPI000ABB5615|nr:ABC transporter [Rhodococcus zopfii]
MRSTGARLFWAATAVYLAIGIWLAVDVHYLQGDALSRASSTRAVLFSRDPHLAAIGFVFTPLTALVQLPVVALSDWWPPITRWGLSGVLMSAPFMAGAVVQIHGIATDRGCPAWLRWTVTATFALHPMILYYGANGMSEAPFLMLLCWALRRLIRWFTTDDVHDLVFAGLALALAYLARYDALAAAAAATALVGAVVWYRRRDSRAALLDGIIVALPSALAFAVWTATSWLITGEALQQFSSQYGNAAILEQSGGGSDGGAAALAFSAAEIVAVAPALALLLPVVAVLAWRRRDPEPLAAMILLAVLGFAALAYFRGLTFPFLRFYLCAVPLLAAAAVFLAPRSGQPPARRPGAHMRPRPADPPNPAGLLQGVGAAGLVLGLPIALTAMFSPTLSQEQHALAAISVLGQDQPAALRSERERTLGTFATERALADYLDAKSLPPGSVLMDTVYGFAVFAASDNPRQFVLPSDEDFTRILNDPAAYGVRYILSVPATGRGTSDAVNRRFPTLYENGAQLATLDVEVPNSGPNQPTWRVWRVVE